MSSRATNAKQHSYQRSDVALGLMVVNPRAQREFREYRMKEIRAELDLDMIGEPVLNWIGNTYHIIDGQHRIAALKDYLGEGWEKQKIPCRVYKGLSDQEEADMFDRLNNVLTVSAYDKFQTRVTAKRDVETAVNNIVCSENLTISRRLNGGVSAVSTLVKVYKRSDGETLRRTLRIIRDSFGDTGFEARIIDGIGLVCQRYNGSLDESTAISKLNGMRGGASGLMGKAVVLHKQTGNSLPQCIAATAIDVINKGRSGKKLPSWWAMSDRDT